MRRYCYTTTQSVQILLITIQAFWKKQMEKASLMGKAGTILCSEFLRKPFVIIVADLFQFSLFSQKVFPYSLKMADLFKPYCFPIVRLHAP